MICANSRNALKLNEGVGANGGYILAGTFATLGVENRNGRIYETDEYLKHLKYLRDDIRNGESLLGELDHPEDRFEVKLKEASHKIVDIWYDRNTNTIQGKIELLDTPNGRIAKSLVDQGIPLHISSRAAGSVNSDKTVTIQQIYTYDLVSKPGFADAVLHRVNESQGAYSEDVYKFLTESESKEKENVAEKYSLMNEDFTIKEISAEAKLREEAKNIQENDANKDMTENTKPLTEDDENKNKDEKINNNDSQENNDNSSEENKEGVKILSVEAEADGVDVKDVEAENGEDDNKEDGEKGNDEKENDEKSEDNKEESEKNEEETSECGDASEKNDGKDDKKELLIDCEDIEKRREDFEDKFADLVDAIKNKSEKKKADESLIISKNPILALMNEESFAGFMGLTESQKNNVIDYLRDNHMVTPEAINENWKNGTEYQPETEIWLKNAPVNYKEMFESADENTKRAIRNTAKFVVFENQGDINTFWINTGLQDATERRLLNEKFVATVKDGVLNENAKADNGLGYSQEFINMIAEQAASYNN